MVPATECLASYFFFVGVGTAGRSCRAAKADCATVDCGFCCFGFFCSRLLRFWPLAIECLLNRSAQDPAALVAGKAGYTVQKRYAIHFAGAGHPRPWTLPALTDDHLVSPVTAKVA